MPVVEHRRLYAKALAKSIRLDFDRNPPRPYSPVDIHDEFGISASSQLEFCIALNRRMAVEFLNYLGRGISLFAFNKRYGADYFRSFFGRDISLANNSHVFSYAEVLHLASHELPLELPSGLFRLLD
jgi:hypothetical protein